MPRISRCKRAGGVEKSPSRPDNRAALSEPFLAFQPPAQAPTAAHDADPTGLARVLTVERALDELEEPWCAREAVWNGDPSATWAWLETSLRCYPLRQQVLAVGSRDRPVACFYLSPQRTPIAAPLTRVMDRLAWAPGTALRDCDQAVDVARRTTSLYLPYIPVTSLPSAANSKDARITGCCIVVDAESWPAYLESRSATLRRSLRAAAARLERAADAPLAGILAPGETTVRLGELAAVEAAGHRRRGRVLSGLRGAFIAQVIAELDGAGHVRTHVFQGSAGIEAYLLGFAASGRYLLYLTAVHANRRSLSLGTLLLGNAIRDAMERSEHIDVGNGLTKFKLRWATGVLPVAHVLIPQRVGPALPPA